MSARCTCLAAQRNGDIRHSFYSDLHVGLDKHAVWFVPELLRRAPRAATNGVTGSEHVTHASLLAFAFPASLLVSACHLLTGIRACRRTKKGWRLCAAAAGRTIST